VSGDAVGDMYLVQDPPLYAIDVWNGSAWIRTTVIGPSGGSIDNRIVRWDGTGGDQMQNSLVAIDDSGIVTPAGASQDLGAVGSKWRRAFANHMVGAVDVFSGASSLDDATFVVAQAGTYTLTLPAATTGYWYLIDRQGSTGVVTLAPGGGDTINGLGSITLNPDTLYLAFAEDATDWRVGGFVNANHGGRIGAVDYDTEYASATASTSSGTYVDAFAGASLTPPSDGDYHIVLTGEFSASNSNTTLEVAAGKNSTTTAIADSERSLDPAAANDITTFYTDSIVSSLVTTDTIHGIFRRTAGSGTAQLIRRRLSMFKVYSP
jgi:hypothetical protein